jgi:toxin ParE1/3/4
VDKPVRLRARAADDIDAALHELITEANGAVADAFVSAVERALGHLGRHPGSGSLRFAYELDIPDLRAWPISRFPYLVFYVERQAEIDVWRILHTRRDLPGTLAADDEPTH